MTKFLVPINTGEQLKFPLHRPLLLFMLNGKIYCCTIFYAGKDFITVTNLQERKITDNGKIIFVDLKLENDVTFKRNRIDGYSPIEDKKSLSPKTNSKARTPVLQFRKRGNNE